MNERLIRDFLVGAASARDLEVGLRAAATFPEPSSTILRVSDMEQKFDVSAAHLAKAVDSVLNGELSPWALHMTSFLVIASDRLGWSDDLVGEILHDLSSPEVNYPLTSENLHRVLSWLARESEYPERPSLPASSSADRVISTLTRESL